MTRTLRLEWRDPAELDPNPLNWRKHPKRQLEGLAAALERVGWAGALLYNERTGRLIDGHARRELRPGEKAPVLVGSWDEAQEREILATLDPLGAAAGVDPEALEVLLAQLRADDSALAELARRLTGAPVPALGGEEPVGEVEPRARVGDLWTLGRHRLLCGDANKEANWERVFLEEQFIALVSDPPYNTNLDGRRDDVYMLKHPSNRFAEAAHWDANFDPRPFLELSLKRAGARANWAVFGGIYLRWKYLYPWFHSRGDDWSLHPFYWVKTFAVANLRQRGFANAVEVAVCAYHRKQHYWNAGHGTDNYDYMLAAPNQGGRGDHITAKPVAVIARLIERLSPLEGIVCDPFLGSGTTLIAAEQLNRTCYALELEPKWVDATVARWEKLTREKATCAPRP